MVSVLVFLFWLPLFPLLLIEIYSSSFHAACTSLLSLKEQRLSSFVFFSVPWRAITNRSSRLHLKAFTFLLWTWLTFIVVIFLQLSRFKLSNKIFQVLDTYHNFLPFKSTTSCMWALQHLWFLVCQSWA